MQSYEVRAEDWPKFLDHFSREHAGWPVTIEILDREFGPQQVARELPLLGISIDRGEDENRSLSVSVGEQTANYSHGLKRPVHIRIAKNEDGSAGTLELEPEQGPAALIHFHEPH